MQRWEIARQDCARDPVRLHLQDVRWADGGERRPPEISDPVAASGLHGNVGRTRGATMVSTAERTNHTIPFIEILLVFVVVLKSGRPDTPAGLAKDIDSMACR